MVDAAGGVGATAGGAGSAAPAGRGRARPALARLVLAAVVLFGLWALVRGLGLDRYDTTGLIAAPIAFTPYVALASVLPLTVALLMRSWREAALAGLVVLVFAGFVVPRALPASAPTAGGDALRVLSLNMLMGEASAPDVVALIRRERPDVVSVQELTEGAVSRLAAAGIDALLPHRALNPEPGASGTGLYSRHPLERARNFDERTSFLMTEAVVRTPNAGAVRVVAVHTAPPIPGPPTARWQRDFDLLPSAPPKDGAPTVLAGDFNASLDHAHLRRLVGTGFQDAAEARGKGLLPSWPSDKALPPVTIDHVLVGGRVDARDVRILDVKGTDHRAVVADLMIRR